MMEMLLLLYYLQQRSTCLLPFHSDGEWGRRSIAEAKLHTLFIAAVVGIWGGGYCTFTRHHRRLQTSQYESVIIAASETKPIPRRTGCQVGGRHLLYTGCQVGGRHLLYTGAAGIKIKQYQLEQLHIYPRNPSIDIART
jgi:hypothetical protein